MADIFGSLIDEEINNQKRAGALDMSLAVSAGANPDLEANFTKLSNITGVPVSSLRLDGGAEAKKIALTNRAQGLPEQAPATTTFLANPENAKVAHDDVENLSTVESILKGLGKPFSATYHNLMAGLTSGVSSFSGELADMAESLGKKTGLEPGGFLRSAQENLDSVSGYHQGMAANQGIDPESFSGQVEQGVGGALPGIVDWAMSVPWAGVKGLEKGGLPGALEEMVKRAALGQVFEAIGNTGMSQLQKMGAMGGTMGLQTAAETAGAGNFSVKDTASSAVVGALLSYGGGGKAETVKKNLLDAGLDPEKANHLSSMVETAHESLEAERNRRNLEEAATALQSSKLFGRLAESSEEHLGEIIDHHGAPETVYVPVEKVAEFFQSVGKKPEEILSDAKSYYEAMQTGADVPISTKEFLARFGKEEAFQELTKDVRLFPGVMNAREAEEWNKDPKRKQEMTDFLSSLSEDNGIKTEADRKIYDDVFGQLIGTGRDRSAAEKEARLMASVFGNLGERAGVDPAELYQQYALKISRPLPDILSKRLTVDMSLDPMLDRLRSGDIPSESEVNGPSLAEFLREKGVQDQGGELSAKEVDSSLKPFQRKMIRESGVPLDQARELAVEAGYLKDGADINDLLNALDDDLRGSPVYSPQAAKYALAEQHFALAQMRDHLDRHGIDFETMTNDEVRQALGERTLFQPGKSYSEGKRAAITITPDRKFEIGLFEKADLSSFLHESGHFYLEVLGDLAERDEAPEQMKADYQTVLQWFGAGSRDEITTEHHEQFARAFEQYLMEGKAPAVELQPIFQRFKAWLTRIYQDVRNLNVPMNDEIRGVFDRIVASDEEIKKAAEYQGLKPLFATAEAAGMTEREFEVYRKDAETAHEKAALDLQKQMMKELARENEKWWKEKKAEVRFEVEAEANENPAYRAFDLLARGMVDGEKVEGVKLSREMLVAQYGEGILKKLPRSFERIYAEGGQDIDLVAETLGFTSADEMLQKLIEAPKKAEYVKAETERRMKEKYGDMLHDGSVEEKALNAVHNDDQGRILTAELRALRRKQREAEPAVKAAKADAKEAERAGREALRQGKEAPIPPLSYFKTMAMETIGLKSDREIRPDLYSRAELKAARDAVDAAAKKDYATAAVEKQKQILNHYLYKEAMKAKGEVEKIAKFMNKADSPRTLGPVGKASQDLLSQMKNILSRYEFKKIPYETLNKSLLEYLEGMRDEYDRDLPIDPKVLDELHRANYREIPMDELRSVYDAVNSLIHTAREINQVTKDGEKVLLDEAKESMISRANEMIPKKREQFLSESSKGRPGSWERFKNKSFENIRNFLDSPSRVEFIMEYLDGGTKGPWHDFFWNKYLEANNAKNEYKEKLLPLIKAIVDDMPKDRKARLYERKHISALGIPLTRLEIITAALNVGNDSNRDKLMRGGIRLGDYHSEINSDALNEILGHLDKTDWDMVQGLWDTVNSLWPDIEALEKRWTGLTPEKVEARKIQTPYGEYAGGYWPIVMDKRGSTAGEKQAQSNKVDQAFGPDFTRAMTRKGHTIERTEAAYPLLLDFRTVMTKHLDNVITDLTHREFVDQFNRLIRSQEMKSVLIQSLGEQEYYNMRGWGKHTVNADNYADPSVTGMDRMFRAAKTNLTVAALGMNVAASLADIGIIPVISLARGVGPVDVARATTQFFLHPKETIEFMHELSPAMRHHGMEIDQSITQSLDYLSGQDTHRAQVMRFALGMRQWIYHIGTTSGWLSAYKKEVSRGTEEKEAVRIADKAVRMVQHAGDAGSLSALERHPMFKHFMMFAGPVVIAYNNMLYGAKETYQRGATPELMGKIFATWFGQGILWTLLRGKGPDDEEPWAEWLATHAILGPLEAFPIIRDTFVPGVEAAVSGKHKYSRGLPLASALENIIKAGLATHKWLNGEAEAGKAVKADLSAAGSLTGIPSNQLDITGTYLFDVLTGQYEPKHPWSPLTDIIYRRRKGE